MVDKRAKQYQKPTKHIKIPPGNKRYQEYKNAQEKKEGKKKKKRNSRCTNRNPRRRTDDGQTTTSYHIIDDDPLAVGAGVVGVAATRPEQTRPAAQAVVGARPADVHVAEGPAVAAADVVGGRLQPAEANVPGGRGAHAVGTLDDSVVGE